jgi:predicted kinase
MSKLVICRGLQGSGKTTFGRGLLKSLLDNGELAMIVERDALRAQGGFGKAPGIYEDVVTAQQTTLVRYGLRKGYTVISTDTNLNKKYVRGLAKHAEFYGAEVEIVDFDLSLDECIERDAKRPDSVGKEVILKTYRRYFAKGNFPPSPLINQPAPVKLEPYAPDLDLPKAKIYDVDGTLAKLNGRSPYDYTRVLTDLPHDDIIQQMREDYANGYKLIVVSGREDVCRGDTLEWLQFYTELPVGEEIPLYMRPENDGRADFIIKYEIFKTHVEPFYNLVMVYDDRDQVIDMWRKINVRAVQVAPGAF